MSNPDPLLELLDRARAGCQESARLLVENYGNALRRVIRRRLNQKVRRRHDSDDILQSVWSDFFSRALNPETYQSPEALLALLSGITIHKTQEANRDHLDAQKRSLTREMPLGDDLPERRPSGEQTIDAIDEFHHLLEPLSPELQKALTLIGDGYTQAEAAAKAGMGERTLARLLSRVREERGGRATG
jgi:DNA-directed RNA polymerase specialized sigma24 family protein